MYLISQARVVVVGGGMVEVDVLEDRRRYTVIECEPAYDPKNERVRS